MSAYDRQTGEFTEVRQVVVCAGEDGYWVAEYPTLPGCITQGKTKEEAVTNIKEAIRGYIAALEEDGLPVAVYAVEGQKT